MFSFEQCILIIALLTALIYGVSSEFFNRYSLGVSGDPILDTQVELVAAVTLVEMIAHVVVVVVGGVIVASAARGLERLRDIGCREGRDLSLP